MSDLNKILLNKKRTKRIHFTTSKEGSNNLNSTSKKLKHDSINIDSNQQRNFTKTDLKKRMNTRKLILLSTKKKIISKKKKIITKQNFPGLKEENFEHLADKILYKEENSDTNYINSFKIPQPSLTNLANVNDISYDSAKISEIQSRNISAGTKNFLSIVNKQEEFTLKSHYEKEIKFCSICFENINFSEKHHLRCGHVFHIKCLSEWFKMKLICPNCKQSAFANSFNFLNENFSLISEAEFNDVIFSDDFRDAGILRNNQEESVNIVNDIVLFLEILDRHRFLVIFVIYVFLFVSIKVVLMVKSLGNF
jgi:hypothetical protein